jgi:hypothetical protein
MAPHTSDRVSNTLIVEAGPYSQPLRHALDVIDHVHCDGLLPVIPLQRAMLTDKDGQFVFQRGGPAVRIMVSHFTNLAEITTVHEVGHFIDYHGLGTGIQCGSVSSAELQGWRDAVRNSQAVQSLGNLWRSSASMIKVRQSDGAVVEYPISQTYLQYLLMPEELWARSYAQFVTIRSNDSTLRHQLDRLQDRPANSYYYASCWEDSDFIAVADEIEAVFRQKGWMK